MIEFSLEVEPKRTGDEWIVGGRCYKGPIRVGDHFKFIYRYEPLIVEGEYTSRRTVAAPIDLQVKKIFTYGRFIDELSNGTTAELTLHASFDTRLVKGDVVADER